MTSKVLWRAIVRAGGGIRRLSVGGLVMALAAGCGGSSPSSPSGGSGGGGGTTVTSIAVTLTSPLKIGQSVQATATATLSNGTTQPVTAGTWASDASAVARVDSSGNVTGVDNGTATISVSSGGRQGQLAIRVVPDYDGAWNGTYLVTTCSESGYFAEQRFCNSTLNTTAPVRFVMTQAGTAVNVAQSLGSLAFPNASATIAADGSLPVGDTALDDTVRILASWTLSSGVSGLVGTTRQRWTVTGRSGDGTLEGRIVTVTKAAVVAGRLPARRMDSRSLATVVQRLLD